MAVEESPVGTYADVTGVVNATAAAEIVVLLATLSDYLPTEQDGSVPASPNFGNMSVDEAQRFKAEMDAAAAAIAAAPTV